MQVSFDYSTISNLVSDCDDAIHNLEHATQKTIGNMREPANALVRTVAEFLNAPASAELRNTFSGSMGILGQRRDRLVWLLAKDSQKSTRSRRITNGKAKRYGVRVG